MPVIKTPMYIEFDIILSPYVSFRRWDSAVSVVTRLQYGQLKNCGSVPGRGKRSFSSRKVQPYWFWGLPSLLLSGDWAPFPWGIKWLVYEAVHSPQSTSEIKGDWGYVSSPPYAFMSCIGTAYILVVRTYVISGFNSNDEWCMFGAFGNDLRLETFGEKGLVKAD